MIIICTILTILFLILFIYWQLKVLSKYNQFDNIKIDTDKKHIIIKNQVILFKEVKNVSVKEVEQPTVTEMYFSRYARNHQIILVEFQLNDLTVIQCQLNNPAQAYKILKQLEPYVKILDNIEDFKPKIIDGPTIFAIILFIAYLYYQLVLKK